MLRKALDAKADVIVFIDHDVSWQPEDLLTLIEAKGNVVAGTYRFKNDSGEFMGTVLPDIEGNVQIREDGGVRAHSIPAGFLKITKECVDKFIDSYPELCYGAKYSPSVDIFNHGAHKGVWYGEDYSFARRWREAGGEIVILPHLQISHWADGVEYAGTYHDYLCKQPGGSEDPNAKEG